MTAAFRILRPGIHTTVQDLGRTHGRAWGVPASGALDPVALQLANALVGNDAGIAALELLYSGITIEVAGGAARIAVACADAMIEPPAQSPIALPAWHSALLQPGTKLRVAAPNATAAAYLAVEGGYAVAAVLGSASTYAQAQLGGFEGRALRAGDTLLLAPADAASRRERRLRLRSPLAAPDVLRVMMGPQADAFTPQALDRLASGAFRVTPASNRSGLRLEGPTLDHRAGHDLLSEGVATGSIQVPGSGQPVVLIGDHPTVGGYPKIATVISADCAAAGRLRIGRTLRFVAVDAHEAAAARREQARWLAEAVTAIEPLDD